MSTTHPLYPPMDTSSFERPLLFSPQLAAAHPPRTPRCPDIFMLSPGDTQFTLAELIEAIGGGVDAPLPASSEEAR